MSNRFTDNVTLLNAATLNQFEDDLKATRSATFIVGFTDGCDFNITNFNGSNYSSNAQTVINAAIEALPNFGGKLLLREGTYNITGSIYMDKDNVTIEGTGNATVLKATQEVTDHTITWTANYCRLENCCIIGSRKSYGVYISGSNNVVTGNTFNEHGVHINLGGTDNTAIENICNHSVYAGITIQGNKCKVIGNTCNYGGGDHIRLNGNECLVSGNICSECYSGIHCSSTSSSTISGNLCIKCYYGIDGSALNSSVTGNTCTNNQATGIDLSDGNNSITGNICNNNSYVGINISGSACNITGNTCKNNNGIGLSCQGNDNIVGNNICNNNSYREIYISGNNNLVSCNRMISTDNDTVYEDYGTNNKWIYNLN